MPVVFSSPSTISLTVALIILVAGAVAFAAVRANNRRLTDALNCMSQGLCMFDARARVVICNQPFLRMYRIVARGGEPGCTLRVLIEQGLAGGIGQRASKHSRAKSSW